MIELKGKNALVTGGSRGLGKATALALAKLGVNVAITGRNEDSLAATLGEIEALGVNGLVLECDATVESDVKSAVQNTVNAFGAIDILIKPVVHLGKRLKKMVHLPTKSCIFN